jgi:LysM repeat protein
MNRPATPRILFLLCVGLCLLLAQVGVSAQADNLLTNPGFEPPFVTFSGETNPSVAQGWQPWHMPAPAGAPSYSNRQPEYSQTSPNTDRILSGTDAQDVFSFFATHDGGVYQRVTGVPAGSLLRFSVNAYAWSTSFDEVDTSEEDGDLIVRVGIDPTGGIDPASASVVWSPAVEKYDAYNLYSVEAASSGNAVTVFVRVTLGFPVKHNHVYLDDAALIVVDGGSTLPTAQPTDIPVIPTDIPVIPTDVPVQPTDVPVIPTDVPVEPTEEPVQPTDVPTDVPVEPTVPPVEASPTPVGSLPTDDPLLLTATAIIGEATKIASDNLTATALAQPTDVPVEPTTVSPTDVPVEPTVPPTAVPVEPTAVQPTSVPPTAVQPTSVVPPTATPEGVGPDPVPTTVQPTSVPVVPTVPPIVNEQFPAMIVHTVQRGESVITLAQRYGSSVDAIAQRNGLGANYLILVGQRLLIPVPVPPPATVTPVPVVGPNQQIPPIGTGNVYVVRAGDTLARIARLFNTTPEALAQLNGIVSEASLQRGQSLQVPGGDTSVAPTPPTGSQQTYTVQRNDTLYWLSIRFGVSIADLARANNIQNTHVIYPGQVLVIP